LSVSSSNASASAASAAASAAAAAAQLPPEYIDFVDLIEQDEANMQDSVKKLKHLHSRRLKVSFGGNEHEQDKEINILSYQIQTLMRRSEANLKQIAAVGNDGNISKSDRICRLNIMRSYAQRLQQISREFKGAQRNFVLSLKGQAEFGKGFFGESDVSTAQNLDDMKHQEEQIQILEQQSKERDSEIEELIQSIAAIQSLFKELSVLVIEQGSMLDRIDYNVESVHVKVKEGRREMEKANEYSKNNRSLVIIAFLTGLMIVLLFLVYLKYTM